MRVHVYFAFVYFPYLITWYSKSMQMPIFDAFKTQVLLRANPGNILCCLLFSSHGRVARALHWRLKPVLLQNLGSQSSVGPIVLIPPIVMSFSTCMLPAPLNSTGVL